MFDTHLSRRKVIQCGLLTTPLAAVECGRRTSPGAERLVSVVRARDYSVDLCGLVRAILSEHKVDVRGKRVLLKPNLVEFSSGAPVNTDPRFVAAVHAAFLASGASDVRIAEGPGHRRITLDLADSAGFFAALPGFERHFTDLNLDEVARVSMRQPFSSLTELYLPQTVLGCDLMVSLPKMKTHHWVGATLSMKNLFGIVPGNVYGWPKNVLHWAGIDESVADLHALFPRQFSIVDGIDGMEGNGPILGSARHAGLVIAGADPPSVDATCCRIMGIDSTRIRYLQLVAARTGQDPAAAHQIGERLDAVSTRFELPPGLESYRLDRGGSL